MGLARFATLLHKVSSLSVNFRDGWHRTPRPAIPSDSQDQPREQSDPHAEDQEGNNAQVPFTRKDEQCCTKMEGVQGFAAPFSNTRSALLITSSTSLLQYPLPRGCRR